MIRRPDYKSYAKSYYGTKYGGEIFMILVTSANGKSGRSIIKQLVKQGLAVKATDIAPETTNLIEEFGVKEVCVGDLTKLSVIKQALENVTQIVFIPPLFSAQEYFIGKALIDEAEKQGIKQFVMVSVTHPIMSTLLQHTAKRDIEEYLVYKGLTTHLSYTILQPMHYMHNFNPNAVKENNCYVSFYDIHTKLSYVDSDDVGEVVAKVLTEDTHDGATYELVSDEYLSPIEMIEIYNNTFSAQAKAQYMDIYDFMEMIQLDDIYSRQAFVQLAETYSKYGIFGNSTVLAQLLGRKPTSFRKYLTREMQQ